MGELWGPGRSDMMGEMAVHQVLQHHAPFSERDILMALHNPTGTHDKPAQLSSSGDLHIYKGRPNWDRVFNKMAKKRHGDRVGVMFCGRKQIAADLKQKCGEFTDFNTGTVFKFYTENF